MSEMVFHVGDTVVDKLKLPKPGDESTRGKVIDVGYDKVVVDWEDSPQKYGGPSRPVAMNYKAAHSMLEVVEIECPACSRAGGAEKGVRHAPPACDEKK